MLTNRTLARINNRPRGVDRRPLLMLGAGTLAITALAAVAFALGVLPYFPLLAGLGGGALLVLALYARQKATMTVRLSYKGKLGGKAASRFSEVREALETLASSEGIWRLSGSSKLPKTGEGRATP